MLSGIPDIILGMANASAVRRVAIGCRAHSGWAALVAIGGSPGSPEVILRRRIENADADIPGSKQPFHAAEPLEFVEAKVFLEECTASTKRLSRHALKAVIEELRRKNYEAVACGVVLGSGRPLPALEAILASHALIHTAEGEFYRDALVEAGKHCGLRVTGVKERELFERGAAQLNLSISQVERCIAELGKPIGPPWTQDQKYAALVAWLALT
jgi:hypothetical protein